MASVPSRPPSPQRPRVVVLRGHQAQPVGAAPLGAAGRPLRRRASCARTRHLVRRRTRLDAAPPAPVRTLRGVLPRGRVGDLAVRAPGRPLPRPGAAPARRRRRARARSSATGSPRRRRGLTRAARLPAGADGLGDAALRSTPTATCARAATAATGARGDRPVPRRDRARARRAAARGRAGRRASRSRRRGSTSTRFAPLRPRRPHGPPLVLSPGRLVWEKGHQDVLRAVALARARGAGPTARACWSSASGPERAAPGGVTRPTSGSPTRSSCAAGVPYDEMPALYASAACMVLASLPTLGLGGAVRHGARRGDGRRRAGRRAARPARSRRSSGPRRRTSRRATGSASPTCSPSGCASRRPTSSATPSACAGSRPRRPPSGWPARTSGSWPARRSGRRALAADGLQDLGRHEAQGHRRREEDDHAHGGPDGIGSRAGEARRRGRAPRPAVRAEPSRSAARAPDRPGAAPRTRRPR